MEKINKIMDFLLNHNKNYTKKQYYLLEELKEIITKKYMLIASFENNENNNLEIIEFDLMKEQALEKLDEILNDEKVESAFICEHGEFEYL